MKRGEEPRIIRVIRGQKGLGNTIVMTSIQMKEKMHHLTIDDISVAVPEGSTVLAAALMSSMVR